MKVKAKEGPKACGRVKRIMRYGLFEDTSTVCVEQGLSLKKRSISSTIAPFFC
jgi:hypothetical protein